MTVLHSGNFILNGNPVLGPDAIVFQEKPVVGLRMDGIPQKQGYNAMEWRYTTVPGDEMKLLQDAWLITRGQGIDITFINTLGVVETGRYYMQQPVIGKRRAFVYDGVVIRFTATYRTGIDPTAPLQAGTSAGYSRFISTELFLTGVAPSETFGSIVLQSYSGPVVVGSDFPAQLNAQPGPYSINDAQYIVVAGDDGGTATLQMWKSTSAGVTWIEMDATNRPESGLTGHDVHTFSVVLIGSLVAVAYPHTTYGDIFIDVFDTVIDTWSAEVHIAGPLVSRSRSINDWRSIYLGQRGDNIYVIAQDEFTTFSSNSLIAYARYTPSGPTWSGGHITGSAEDGTDYVLLGACTFDDDFLMVWRERATGGGDGTIKMRILDSTYSLGTIETVDACLWSDTVWASPILAYIQGSLPMFGMVYVEPSGDIGFLDVLCEDVTDWELTTLVSSPIAFTGKSVILDDPDVTNRIHVLWLADGIGISKVTRVANTWGSSSVIATGEIVAFSASMRSGGSIDIAAQIGTDIVYIQVLS